MVPVPDLVPVVEVLDPGRELQRVVLEQQRVGAEVARVLRARRDDDDVARPVVKFQSSSNGNPGQMQQPQKCPAES